MSTWILIIFLINFHNGDSQMKIIGSYDDSKKCSVAAKKYMASHHDKKHNLDYSCEYVIDRTEENAK